MTSESDSGQEAHALPVEMPPRRTPLVRGDRVGRYIIGGLVGRGAMGEVYRAYDPELGRHVAIKLVRGLDGDVASVGPQRKRLLREARAMARIRHRNVIAVHDVGNFEDGVFIAMDFVVGSTVRYWLLAANRGWENIVRVFIEAGRGLAAAHDEGVIHHDFKPDNVMIGRDGQVLVTDFGLARELRGSNRDTDQFIAVGLSTTVPLAPLSRTGGATRGHHPSHAWLPAISSTDDLIRRACRGTPAYMSPEQFLGMATDERTDQFSFCVALYEAIYGLRPFAGKNVLEIRGNVFSGRVSEEPARIRVPKAVRRVLLRGMNADPGARFPSMHVLLAALEKAAIPATRRRRRAIGVACALLTALSMATARALLSP